MVEYSIQLMGLVRVLESVGLVVSEIERKRTFLRGLPAEFVVIIEDIITAEGTSHQSVSRLMV